MKKPIIPILLALTLTACDPKSVTLTLEKFDKDVELHTDIQLERFINNPEVLGNFYNTVTYVDDLIPNTDYTIPGSVQLKWAAAVDRGSISSYTVKLSEKSDMSSALEYSTGSTSLDVTNLKINTAYYWTVSYKSFVSEVGTFKTNNTVIRGINVEGVKNVRDLGSFYKIKQGLLYRGGEFESYNKSKDTLTTLITSNGARTLTEEWKIKTEIDLRKNDEESKENGLITKSSVDGLNYRSLPMFYGGKNLLTYSDDTFNNPARIKDFFEILADQNNYPIYFHCSQGKDRTGILAYLIESLLGQDKDDIYKDYLYSNLADKSFQVKRTGIDNQYGETLEEYASHMEGTPTHQEIVYSYLSEVIGVKTTDLDKIISFLR